MNEENIAKLEKKDTAEKNSTYNKMFSFSKL